MGQVINQWVMLILSRDLCRGPDETSHAKLIFTNKLGMGGTVREHCRLDPLAFDVEGDEVFVHTRIYHRSLTVQIDLVNPSRSFTDAASI